MKRRFYLLLWVLGHVLGIPAMACGIHEGEFGYYQFFGPQQRQLPEFMGFTHHYRENDWRPSRWTAWATMIEPGTLAAVQEEANIRSWKYHFGKAIGEGDIRNIVYGGSLASLGGLQLEGDVPFKKRPKPEKSWAPKYPYRLWSEGKFVDEFNYLLYAKECEPYCNTLNWWGDIDTLNAPNATALIERGKAGYASTKIPFVKLRYAYQIVRLSQYYGHFDQAIADYRKYALPVLGASKEIGAWVTCNYAGCLRQKKRYAEAAYAFSRVYANSPSRGIQARWGWRINHDWQWDQVMALCKNDREKADNHALRALSYNSIPHEDMRAMQALDPGREDLDLILVREINKLELDFFGASGFGSTAFKDRILRREYARKAHHRVEELDAIVVDGLAKHQAYDSTLWQIAHSYLLFLGGNFQASQAYMNGLKPRLSGENLLRAQQLELVMLLVHAGRITPSIEARLAKSSIQRRKWNAEMEEKFLKFRDDALFWKYMEQGDECKASLIKHPSALLQRFGVRSSLLDSVIAFYDKPGKNALEEEMMGYLKVGNDENYWWDGNGMNREDLLATKATSLIVEGNLDAAIAILDTLPETLVGLTDADPFRPRIKRQDSKTHLWTNQIFDKRSFARTVRKLLANTNKDDGKNHLRYILLGNAWFNTLEHNRAQGLKNCSERSGWHLGYEAAFLKRTTIDGHSAKLWPRNLDTKPAIRFYERAIAATENQEAQALATYMIARCQKFDIGWISFIEDQKAHPAKGWRTWEEVGEKLDHLPAFETLRTRYAETEFYDLLIQECELFAQYCNN